VDCTTLECTAGSLKNLFAIMSIGVASVSWGPDPDAAGLLGAMGRARGAWSPRRPGLGENLMEVAALEAFSR